MNSIKSALFDHAPEALLVIDGNGMIAAVNDTWTRTFGCVAEKAVGSFFLRDLISDDQDNMADIILEKLQQGKSIFCADVIWKRQNNTTFWSRVRAKAIDRPDCIGIISVRDLSFEAQLHDRISEYHLFIKALLDSLGEGVVVLDPEYRILETNRKFDEMTGLGREQLIGKLCCDISRKFVQPCTDSNDTPLHCPARSAGETGKKASCIHTHKSTSGRNHYVEIRSYPLFDEDGKIFQIIELHNDITERKNLEERINHMEKLEAVGNLAGGVAHDLNNILTPILGNAELALDSLPNENPLYVYFREISDAARRAESLVRQILAFSRRQLLDKKHLNLNNSVNSLLKMLNRLIREDIRIETNLSEEIWDIFADYGQIDQIIINLVVNARDAMPTGGRIFIETTNVTDADSICHTCKTQILGDHVLLMVSDNGTGIKPEVAERIFEPFFTTKETGKGTGMGLATVLGIVHQHGGHINLYSEAERGTTFKVYFPKPMPDEIEKTGRFRPRKSNIALFRGNETILIADDDPGVRSMAERVLTSLGHTVLTAENGIEALLLLKNNKTNIDLLVADIIMPHMGGKELHKELMNLGMEIPVLFMSGYSENVVHHNFTLDHSRHFIQKPLTMERLATKIREALTSTKGK